MRYLSGIDCASLTLGSGKSISDVVLFIIVVAEVEMRGWWGSEAGFVIACSVFPVVELRHFGIS